MRRLPNRRLLARAVALFAGVAALLAVRFAAAEDIVVLLTGFAAKEGCSCVFVAGQSDDYCTNFAQGEPSVITVAVTIDHAAMTVTGAIGSTSRTAHYAAGAGCTLTQP